MINLTCLAAGAIAFSGADSSRITLPAHVTLFDLAHGPARLWEAQLEKSFSGSTDDVRSSWPDGSSPPLHPVLRNPRHALATRYLSWGRLPCRTCSFRGHTRRSRSGSDTHGVPGVDEHATGIRLPQIQRAALDGLSSVRGSRPGVPWVRYRGADFRTSPHAHPL